MTITTIPSVPELPLLGSTVTASPARLLVWTVREHVYDGTGAFEYLVLERFNGRGSYFRRSVAADELGQLRPAPSAAA